MLRLWGCEVCHIYSLRASGRLLGLVPLRTKSVDILRHLMIYNKVWFYSYIIYCPHYIHVMVEYMIISKRMSVTVVLNLKIIHMMERLCGRHES